MRLGDLKRDLGAAILSGDIASAKPIVDRLRHRGWRTATLTIEPFTYADLYAFASDAVAAQANGLALSSQAWDRFLYDMDEDDAA